MKARARIDPRDSRTIVLYVDARHFGAALDVAEEAQCSPPLGYRWERIAMNRKKNGGAGVRVSVTWRHMLSAQPILEPAELQAHAITGRLVELAGGADS